MESIIRAHSLFSGLDDKEYLQALSYFRANRAQYRRGENLNRLGDPLSAFGLVLSGIVQVYMHDYDGQPIIMAHVHPGDTFGESLCYLKRDTAVMIHAETDVQILWLRTEGLHSAPHSPLEQILNERFVAMLAERALSQNGRIQVLSKISLRAKIITYLSQYAQTHGEDFTLPLNRATLALYLGTDRSALSRELSRMQEEGILSYERNHFVLHHRETL